MTSQQASKSEAIRIYQDILDELSEATTALDFDTVRARHVLPFVRRTLASEVVIETEEDLFKGHRGVAFSLMARGVDQYIRLVSDAEFLSPHYIEGHHVTHMLRGAARVMPSYSNRVILQKVKGVWKLSELDSDLENAEWPYRSLAVPDLRSPVRQLPMDPTDVRHTSAEPLDLYQQFIDNLTRANIEEDVDAYCNMCSFPYTVHHDQSDIVVTSRKEIRPAFDTITNLLRKHRTKDLERRAKRAEFISGNRICGYHDSLIYSDGQIVVGPIQSRMILERSGPQWRLKSVTNSITNEKYPYSDPVLAETLVTIRQIQERQRL